MGKLFFIYLSTTCSFYLPWMILVPLPFLGCHLCWAYCSNSAFFLAVNINKIKSSFELTSTQFRCGGLQKPISWQILNCVQLTVTSGVSVHFNIFRNECTCTTRLKVDMLVNYRHAELHHLRFDIYLCILVGVFNNNKHRSRPKSD